MRPWRASRLGTPAYMAPEQAEGRTDLIDARTDIYGLGTILFEILTGKRPAFAAGTILELLDRIAHSETPKARSVEPSVPRPLEAICGTGDGQGSLRSVSIGPGAGR